MWQGGGIHPSVPRPRTLVPERHGCCKTPSPAPPLLRSDPGALSGVCPARLLSKHPKLGQRQGQGTCSPRATPGRLPGSGRAAGREVDPAGTFEPLHPSVPSAAERVLHRALLESGSLESVNLDEKTVTSRSAPTKFSIALPCECEQQNPVRSVVLPPTLSTTNPTGFPNILPLLQKFQDGIWTQITVVLKSATRYSFKCAKKKLEFPGGLAG